MNRKRGFTLIELLVVIAIIGILSSIVLIALRGARNKAKDARIIAEMSQLRSIAEMAYENGSYSGFDRSRDDVADIEADIDQQLGGDGTGTPLTIVTESGEYCVYTALNTGAPDTYCIDSSGVAVQLSAAPTVTCAAGQGDNLGCQ